MLSEAVPVLQLCNTLENVEETCNTCKNVMVHELFLLVASIMSCSSWPPQLHGIVFAAAAYHEVIKHPRTDH